MNTHLVDYYRQRAKEYEQVYAKPERQHDLQQAEILLKQAFAGKTMLEICCGTGYWTERIAQTATAIHATDINDTVLDIAQQKDYGNTPVSFEMADFYSYPVTRLYDGLFGGFIWSHIQLQHLQAFLQKTGSFVRPGGTIVFMDNIYVAGSNLPVTHTDEQGNTFQTRTLEDGSTHLVRKNFPTEAFIKEQLKDIAGQLQVIRLEYYWLAVLTKAG